jgi:hypothetical protein
MSSKEMQHQLALKNGNQNSLNKKLLLKSKLTIAMSQRINLQKQKQVPVRKKK